MFKNKYDTESLTVEDPFGKYPCMVMSDNFIARENIIRFIKTTTDLNTWLTVPQAKTLDWLEDLVIHKLYPVTQMQLIRDRRPEISSIVRYLHSPLRSIGKWIELRSFIELNEKYLNLHGSMQMYDAAKEVYEKLSNKLGQNKYFFQKGEHEGSSQISSLDLVVYGFIKHQLVNIPESNVVKMLNKDYKNLINFVKHIETCASNAKINKQLRATDLKLSKSPIEQTKIAHNLMQPSEFTSKSGDTDRYEDVSADGVRKNYVRKVYVVLMAASFMAYLKYARTPF